MKLKKLPYELTVCKVEDLPAINQQSSFFFLAKTDVTIQHLAPSNSR